MAIIRLKNINNMSSAERTKKLAELRAELSRMRTMISAGGAVENPTRVRELRRTIAQILTIENEYKQGIRQTDGAAKKSRASKTKQSKESA